MNAPTLHIAPSPHVFEGDSIPRIMWSVVLALLPAVVWAVFLFGWRAAWVTGLAVVACLACEAVAVRFRGRRWSLTDGSAALTGLLLALNLPPSSPWWIVVLGSAVAILLGKQVFGGLGQNPFNPALVARVVLLISFPVQMTTWGGEGGWLLDAVTAATPLGDAKTALSATGTVADAMARIDWLDLAIGLQPGSLGEVSEVALLLGAAFLLWRRVITWDIPLAFVLATAVVTGLAWGIEPDRYLPPWTHLVSGGLVLGAFYMATDMVTSPLTTQGRWVFGVGCGVLTAVIRLWGGYPEGASFAILLMNACVPLIDRGTQPTRFGDRPAPEGGTP